MRTAAISLLLCLMLAACGGAPPPGGASPGRSTPGGGSAATPPGQAATPPGQAATPGGGVQPPAGGMCALLSAAEVSQVVGQPAAVAEDQSDQDNCTYNVGAPDELIPEYVVDVRLESGDFTGPKAAFPGGQDVSGIGQGAYWAPSVSVFWFVNGGQMYAIQFVLFGEDDGDALALAQRLAQALIAKL